MNSKAIENLPDNTPVIIGSGQYTERIPKEGQPSLSSPMAIAAMASTAAIGDAGGTQPLQLLQESLTTIARGETQLVLLAGAEAIANQRFAQRNALAPNWNESFDVPMDSRVYRKRFAAAHELASGMFLPAHYYSLIENRQAQELGHTPQQHREYMARLLAPFSKVAANNPHSFNSRQYDINALVGQDRGNYPITVPYSKLLIAQDSVNQGAALLITSVGKARQLGVNPARWIFVQAYAEGTDQHLVERVDPARSDAMRQVLQATLAMAGADARDMEFIDLYSCFPCAVHAACEVLDLPVDGSVPLTVTGGLPFFGGPGSNYPTHALAEMVARLRGGKARGLVTANGGNLWKHAAAVLGKQPSTEASEPINWENGIPFKVATERIPSLACCEGSTTGRIITYTVIAQRQKPDIGIVLAETPSGQRLLAHSLEPALTESMWKESPIGREIQTTWEENRHRFTMAD